MGWGTSLWMNWKQKKRRDRSHAKSSPFRELLQILFYGNSATVNALLGNVFLTSDMPSRYTDAQRDEYRRLRRLFEHAKQVEVETENGVITIRYSLDEKRQELRCSAIYRE